MSEVGATGFLGVNGIPGSLYSMSEVWVPGFWGHLSLWCHWGQLEFVESQMSLNSTRERGWVPGLNWVTGVDGVT